MGDANERMRQLLNGAPAFSSNEVIMKYKLYTKVRDHIRDANAFVNVLEEACRENDVHMATIFKNHVTPTGDSLLHVAAQHGSELVRYIASHYPDLLYKPNFKGDTPLHVAARAKNLAAIEKILDLDDKHFMKKSSSLSSASASLSSSEEEEEAESKDKVEFIMLPNNYGMTALHEAVLSKDFRVVDRLLSAHKTRDLTNYWTWCNHKDGCNSPMYLAVLIEADQADQEAHQADQADQRILDLLLKIPIPSDKAISSGDSPLHAAISERNNGKYTPSSTKPLSLLNS